VSPHAWGSPAFRRWPSSQPSPLFLLLKGALGLETRQSFGVQIAFAKQVPGIGRQVLVDINTSRGPFHGDAFDRSRAAKAEMQTAVTRGKVAAAAGSLAHLIFAKCGHRNARARSIAVGGTAFEPDRHEMAVRALPGSCLHAAVAE